VAGAPLVLAVAGWGDERWFVPPAIALESIVTSAALVEFTKVAAHRPRPYAYRGGVHSGAGFESFPSGHVAASFAAATSTVVLLQGLDRDPAAAWAAVAGFTAAAGVGVLRVVAGKHFPTDVAGGAAVGAAAGWLVPSLVRTGDVRLAASPDGVALVGRL
jgi:membrane-associated phospholipid phosphatase